MKKVTTATQLRLILSVTLFVIVGLGVGLAVVARGKLTAVAEQTSNSLAQAKASDGAIQSLQMIQKKLDEQKDSVKQAEEVVGLSKGYTYQDQVIRDLNTYASKSGISINNIDFASGDSKTASGSSAATPAPSSPSSSGSPAAASTPASVKASTVTVTLGDKTSYENLLTFFNMVEQSLPKLQILSIGLSNAKEGGGVTSQALQIDVYIR